MRGLLEAVEYLAAELLGAAPNNKPPQGNGYAGPPLASWEATDAFIPSVRTAQAQLAALSPADREAVLRQRLAQVVDVRRDARAVLSTAGHRPDLLDRVRAVAAAQPGYHWPLTSFGLPSLDRLLLVDRGSTATAKSPEQLRTDRAHALVLAELGQAPAHPVDLATVCSDAADAAALLCELRCLHDVFARIGIAAGAAEAVRPANAAAPVARALAHYRVEGDFAVPPSLASLAGADVAATSGVHVRFPPGRSRADYVISIGGRRPHMHSLAFLVPRSFLPTKGEATGEAQAAYHLLVVGFDVVFNDDQMLEDAGVNDKFEWMAINRHAVDPTTSEADAEAAARSDWNARLAMLEAEPEPSPPTTGPEYFIVAPNDPIRYTGGIVAEALAWMHRLTDASSFIPGLSGPLPELVTYLRYHQNRRKSQALLASALSRAHTHRGAASAALRAELAQAPQELIKLLADVRGLSHDDTVDAVDLEWGTLVAPFLAGNGVLDLTVDWIRHATETDWPSWVEVRANLLRYERVYLFYSALTA